jgi:site-specific DNA-methyltransferase (adenine-specific)
MDCMELMRDTPDKYYDIAIVDPPYGIGEDGSKNKSRGMGIGSVRKKALGKSKDYKAFEGNDLSSPDLEYFKELKRISVNQIIWGANHFISSIPFNSSCWIVWDKDNGLNDFADAELAYTSFKSAVRIFKYKWHGMLQQKMGVDKEIRIHPTQKPVDLYKWCLDKYAKNGYKILDTHGGSFSHAIACHDYGFELDICELDKHYFELGCLRLQQHQSQTKLF